MEVHEARAVLGVVATDDWPAIRLAYRKLIREIHPDRAGERTTVRAAELNEAYALLTRVLQAPRRVPAPPPPTTRSGTSLNSRIDKGHILVLSAPPEIAFTRLLEAGHVIGHVSYVDRSSAIFEVVVQHNGEACSLVVSLEEHPDGSEALCTMESIERVFQPAPEPVVLQLLAAIRAPWVSGPSPSSS